MARTNETKQRAQIDNLKREVLAAAARDPEAGARAAGYAGDLKPDSGGKLLRGRCPFPGHVDEHPSFTVDGASGKDPGDWRC